MLVVGVDTATVYTRKDIAGDELRGEPDLLAYVRLPKDLCVALTQQTNGSVFRCVIIHLAQYTCLFTSDTYRQMIGVY